MAALHYVCVERLADHIRERASHDLAYTYPNYQRFSAEEVAELIGSFPSLLIDWDKACEPPEENDKEENNINENEKET